MFRELYETREYVHKMHSFWHAEASDTKRPRQCIDSGNGVPATERRKKKTGVNSRVTARSFTKGHKSLAKIKLQLVNISRNVYTVKSNENDRFKDQHVNK